MKTSKTHPPAFHVMTKPTGAVCNLDCSYCYFLSKELLYPGSRFRMADQLLENYIRQYIAAQQVNEITFAWQGGEPTLMGLPFFERALFYQRKYAQSGKRITNTLQTNGTLLDDSWCQFFQENNFLIGISLDGPQEIHDVYRKNKGGVGSFAQVIQAWQLLQRYQVETNILCTVHAQNQNRPLELYHFFRDTLGAQFIQFIPIVERAQKASLSTLTPSWHQRLASTRNLMIQAGHQVTTRSVDPRKYGEFLIAIFDEWVRKDVGQVFVQVFDVALGAWLGRPGGLCIFAPTCGTALALEHNGDLYSCDHYVEPDYLLGNIEETLLIDLVASEKQHQFGQAKKEALPDYCRQCSVLFACHGGCPKNRFIQTPRGEPGLNYLCAGYKAFFTHITKPMTMMARLIRQRRPPAEIMDYMAMMDKDAMARALDRTGRNDSCPCGSEKKYKHCHGRIRAPGNNQGLAKQ